jgi:hypothetical protein
MDSIGHPDHDIDYAMEPALSDALEESSNPGSVKLHNLEDDQRLNTPTPGDLANYRGPAAYYKPPRVDGSSNILTLSGRAHGRSFVALPDVFDSRMENYRQF